MANTYSTALALSSSQYWSVAHASQTGLDVTSPYTFEIWVKIAQLPTTATTDFVLFDKRSTTDGYRLMLKNDDKLRLVSENSNTIDQYNSDAVFVDGDDVDAWVHIALTYNAGTVIMYKDGEIVANSHSGSETSTGSGTQVFQIGASSSGGVNRYFDGDLDEARIWNDVRTQSEIQDNMSVELEGDEANLQGYWKFNNDAGVGYTTNENDLTNNNSCTFTTDVPFVGAVAPTLTGVSSVTGFSTLTF